MENSMTLHQNKELFSELLIQTAQMVRLPEVYIEKDYWVTYVLKRLSESPYIDRAIFKGGTSLSKAYKLIERFSEDIDLAVITHGESSNQIKTLIKKIEKGILDGNFQEIDDLLTSKGSAFRKTVHTYPISYEGDFGHAYEHIVVELNAFAKPHPFSPKKIATYINDFLKVQAPQMIIEYELEAFDVNVLDYRRTFCEKLSAIARATFKADKELIELKNKIRHLYDIYYLMQEEEIQTFLNSSAFVDMIHNVREDDIEQFQGTWNTQALHKAFIFSDTQACMNGVGGYYTSTFSDLVYGSIPDILDVQTEVEKVAIVLKNKSL
jgi:predicted nucleotidyltransferase component of viral defense system